MERLRLAELDLRMQHRHNDGTWSTLERRPDHHDAGRPRPGAGLGERAGLRLHDLRRGGPDRAERGGRRSARLTRSGRPVRVAAQEPSAAEATDHVVEHGQAEPQRLEADPFVHAVEALEEPLIRFEAQR